MSSRISLFIYVAFGSPAAVRSARRFFISSTVGYSSTRSSCIFFLYLCFALPSFSFTLSPPKIRRASFPALCFLSLVICVFVSGRNGIRLAERHIQFCKPFKFPFKCFQIVVMPVPMRISYGAVWIVFTHDTRAAIPRQNIASYSFPFVLCFHILASLPYWLYLIIPYPAGDCKNIF